MDVNLPLLSIFGAQPFSFRPASCLSSTSVLPAIYLVSKVFPSSCNLKLRPAAATLMKQENSSDQSLLKDRQSGLGHL